MSSLATHGPGRIAKALPATPDVNGKNQPLPDPFRAHNAHPSLIPRAESKIDFASHFLLERWKSGTSRVRVWNHQVQTARVKDRSTRMDNPARREHLSR